MCFSFSFSATPSELLKASILCLEQVTQMRESLERKKKAVIFWLLITQGPNSVLSAPSSRLTPSFRCLSPLTLSPYFF